jgi:hypothetical protein
MDGDGRPSRPTDRPRGATPFLPRRSASSHPPGWGAHQAHAPRSLGPAWQTNGKGGGGVGGGERRQVHGNGQTRADRALKVATLLKLTVRYVS